MELVDVCICTYRRPSVVQTIASIAQQTVRDRIDVHLIVADNDEQDDARPAIEAAAAAHGIALTYVHAPSRNIAIARNACLTAATADWLAFIDDDEVASHDWLAQLLARRDDAEFVFGLVVALYDPATTAPWMVAGDYHSTRMAGNEAAHNGGAGNVLIRRAFVDRHQCRFDLVLGRSGGEDTIFFERAQRAGARFRHAPAAVAYEEVAAARARLGWLVRRRFRAGQIHRTVLKERGASVAGAVAPALAKLGYCAAATLLTAYDRKRATQHLLRGMLHAGFVASAFGMGTYQEYAAGAKSA